METKIVKFEIKSLDTETGTFEGYAATFSDMPDSYGDVIEPGAFTKTIQETGKRIKVLWNHNVNEPIGKPLELEEDEHGLRVKAKLSLGVQRAREVLSLMKDGVINEMSIGYDTITGPVVSGIRHLKEIRLWDVSPVTFAANPEAEILAVKSAIPFKALEEILNEIKGTLNKAEALLATEPVKSTQPDTEAAHLEETLNTINAELEGFDAQEAEKRLEVILDQINSK